MGDGWWVRAIFGMDYGGSIKTHNGRWLLKLEGHSLKLLTSLHSSERNSSVARPLLHFLHTGILQYDSSTNLER